MTIDTEEEADEDEDEDEDDEEEAEDDKVEESAQIQIQPEPKWLMAISVNLARKVAKEPYCSMISEVSWLTGGSSLAVVASVVKVGDFGRREVQKS